MEERTFKVMGEDMINRFTTLGLLSTTVTAILAVWPAYARGDDQATPLIVHGFSIPSSPKSIPRWDKNCNLIPKMKVFELTLQSEDGASLLQDIGAGKATCMRCRSEATQNRPGDDDSGTSVVDPGPTDLGPGSGVSQTPFDLDLSNPQETRTVMLKIILGPELHFLRPYGSTNLNDPTLAAWSGSVTPEMFSCLKDIRISNNNQEYITLRVTSIKGHPIQIGGLNIAVSVAQQMTPLVLPLIIDPNVKNNG